MGVGYFSLGVLVNYQPDFCYLCGKKLEEPLSPDHVIPDNLFTKGDPNRPKILVHHACNQKKSIDDQWFAKIILLRCGFNPIAEHKFSEFMDDAISEKKDAFLIGKRPSRYVLARRIFDKAKWGLELIHDGISLKQLELSIEDRERFV